MEAQKRIMLMAPQKGKLIRQKLQENYLQVDLYDDPVQGILDIFIKKPDLIVLEDKIGPVPGLAVLAYLKRYPAIEELPVVYYALLTDIKELKTAESFGIDYYFEEELTPLDDFIFELLTITEEFFPGKRSKDLLESNAPFVERENILQAMSRYMEDAWINTGLNLKISRISENINSLQDSLFSVLKIVYDVCQPDISVIFLPIDQRIQAFILPVKEVLRQDYADFSTFCLSDFYAHFPQLDLDNIIEKFYGIEKRNDFDKIRLDTKKISSYRFYPLRDKQGGVFGTIHFGNFQNHYFNEEIVRDLDHLMEQVRPIIDNALSFHKHQSENDTLLKIFRRFVPEEIISDMLESEGMEALSVGERRRIAILFTDIRSFTTISENNTAQNVVDFLNMHFKNMVDCIKKESGSIDKFIGDAILAFFGVPRSFVNNSLQAAKAAAAMIRVLHSCPMPELVLPDEGFNVGIGLHEGLAIVGNIGSLEHFDYTAVGTSISIAEKLEGLTKLYHKPILLSEEVKEKVEEHFLLRWADSIMLEGQSSMQNIYALEVFDEEYSGSFIDRYNEAVYFYQEEKWQEAQKAFQDCLNQKKDDSLSQLYVERLALMRVGNH